MKDGEEEDECHYHMDVLWHHLSKVNGGDGRLTFPRLSKVSKLVFTIPQSNAGEESIFYGAKKQNSFSS